MENGKWKMKNVGAGIFCFSIFLIQYLFSIFYFRLSFFLLIIHFSLVVVYGQKIAVLTPEKNNTSKNFSEKLEDSLSKKVKILDASLSEAAFRAQTFEKPFNLSLIESKSIGAAIGTEFFLLVKAENLRRSSLTREEFYESYAIIFTVSARTGRLVLWKLNSFEADKKEAAERKLFDSTNALAMEISEKIKSTNNEELNEKPAPNFEKLPEENSIAAKFFRPPLPYKRMRPAYTPLANLYSIEATVDIEIDVGETGEILRTETVRWAGFGLDESAIKNIRQMTWRPAEYKGKTIPVRVLLRYNFKKKEAE